MHQNARVHSASKYYIFCHNLCYDVIGWWLQRLALQLIYTMCNFAKHFCNFYVVIMHQMPKSPFDY